MISTQTEQENITLIRRGYDAFQTGDMKTLTDLFSADVKWHQNPTGVISGLYEGRDAVLQYFAQLKHETNGSITAVPVAFAATSDKVFVETHLKGVRKGTAFEDDVVTRFTVREGKIRDVASYSGNYQNMLNAWK